MEYDDVIVQSELSNESIQHWSIYIKPIPNQETNLSDLQSVSKNKA